MKIDFIRKQFEIDIQITESCQFLQDILFNF